MTDGSATRQTVSKKNSMWCFCWLVLTSYLLASLSRAMATRTLLLKKINIIIMEASVPPKDTTATQKQLIRSYLFLPSTSLATDFSPINKRQTVLHQVSRNPNLSIRTIETQCWRRTPGLWTPRSFRLLSSDRHYKVSLVLSKETSQTWLTSKSRWDQASRSCEKDGSLVPSHIRKSLLHRYHHHHSHHQG